MAKHIKSTQTTLEDGENGTDRVVIIETDLVVDAQQPGYDDQKFAELVKEAGEFLKNDKADRARFVGKGGSRNA